MKCEECSQEFRRPKHGSNFCSVVCRFMAKVDIRSPEECWEWLAGGDSRGYGQFSIGGRKARGGRGAHRASYELFVEPIPDGLQIDHLCRNTICVNPDHLEPVTQRENALRGAAPSIAVHLTGVCRRGHSMDDAIVKKTTGRRQCRTCHNWLRREKYAGRTV